MTGALAPFAEKRGAGGIEHHHGLRRQRAALGGAERQHVDAGLPGHLRRRGVEPHQGIGEARAIHVHGERAGVRDVAQARDLVGAIDGAGLARLRERQRRGDHLVRAVAAIAVKRRLQRLRRDLAVAAGKAGKLQPAAEKLRRAAFVGRDMGLGMAEHDAPGRRDLRQRQRIGRGPGRHQEHRHLALEDLRQPPLDAGGPVVIAVAAAQSRYWP